MTLADLLAKAKQTSDDVGSWWYPARGLRMNRHIDFPPTDAAHIAACSPEAIIALIESHERLRRALLMTTKGGSAAVWQKGRDAAKQALAECPQ